MLCETTPSYHNTIRWCEWGILYFTPDDKYTGPKDCFRFASPAVVRVSYLQGAGTWGPREASSFVPRRIQLLHQLKIIVFFHTVIVVLCPLGCPVCSVECIFVLKLLVPDKLPSVRAVKVLFSVSQLFHYFNRLNIYHGDSTSHINSEHIL